MQCLGCRWRASFLQTTFFIGGGRGEPSSASPALVHKCTIVLWSYAEFSQFILRTPVIQFVDNIGKADRHLCRETRKIPRKIRRLAKPKIGKCLRVTSYIHREGAGQGGHYAYTYAYTHTRMRIHTHTHTHVYARTRVHCWRRCCIRAGRCIRAIAEIASDSAHLASMLCGLSGTFVPKCDIAYSTISGT